MGRNTWELFAENLPIPKSPGIFYEKKRNLIYVGGSKWSFSDVRYAKVKVVQGKGGGYISTVLLSGVLKIGEYENLYM
ncbi:hypothetical protein SASPL_118067 [Salvia splendens]|uniref:Uncharacterized protein n=1 Tax=Salvia splendens TaxID=180675 RepID=A0A8X8ZYS9_SALSN|nr:hypothetical protein SASPL_118067 [Salvia splendens]